MASKGHLCTHSIHVYAKTLNMYSVQYMISMVKTLCITCEVEGDASAETSSHFGHFERPHSMEQWATEVCELTLSTRHEGCFLLRSCAFWIKMKTNFCAAYPMLH